jgi:uncharacterized protein YkwD
MAVAFALFSLVGGGGVASAGAAEAEGSSELPVELTPCLLWGDALPVELGRVNARKTVLCLINRERARAGVRAVEHDRRLRRASQRHTATMLRTECVVHRCPGEARLKRRLSRYLAGRPRTYRFGEVIGWAPVPLASPSQIVDQLMQSPAHRAHILDPAYEHAGVGFAVGNPVETLIQEGVYTIDFGMRIG